MLRVIGKPVADAIELPVAIPFHIFSCNNETGQRALWYSTSLPSARILEAALCWISLELSYSLNTSLERWPVHSWITFLGMLALNRAVAAVARRELFLLASRPAFKHMFLTISPKVFLPISTAVYQDPLMLFMAMAESRLHLPCVHLRATCWYMDLTSTHDTSHWLQAL